ncbi:glyoxalase family protein [Salinimicrobium catena]|uniref:Glyoxalase family protein n=1 Tax=Salinimicrobium catena TaxID=390640 RepID=A0A1H5IXB7_9FLAO|nr:ring-cleaving dioxygenase [Salinimicrobium catena]SDK81733.1 glyoxalase family protein [Salinimicrobium catena]SEE44842.1 glyoxalase family protein [Salinimicrobium catena]
MKNLITGIHHVTALAGEPQQNLYFYTGILGLRMVKKTVNFDAPEVYHFYYGNELGEPGSIMTFFPYEGIQQGRPGKGMLNVTTFSVPDTSREFWENRLKQYNVSTKPVEERFEGESVLYFEDPDGLGLELVFNSKDDRPGFSYGNIPEEHAIKGFYSVEIWQERHERTAALLTEVMDHQLIAEKGNRFRFAATDKPGNYIDIVSMPNSQRGLGGGGTVHHIAFNTADVQTQAKVRENLLRSGLQPTPVVDRQYFESIYFREPGGVLFEVATAQPGFAVDEEPQKLGEKLMLPAQYEAKRDLIEKAVKPVQLNPQKFK